MTNTGYIVNNYGSILGNNLDLVQIFQPGTSSVITGYKISNNNDIGNLFQPWDSVLVDINLYKNV